MTNPDPDPPQTPAPPSPATFEELVQILAEADPQRTGIRLLAHDLPPPGPPMRYLDLWVEDTGRLKVFRVPAHPIILEEIRSHAGRIFNQMGPNSVYSEAVVFAAGAVISRYPAHPRP